MDEEPQPDDAVVGTVRWFNAARGFGFIAPETGGEDVFVSQADIAEDGFRTLDVDERVTYQPGADGSGPCARSVRRA